MNLEMAVTEAMIAFAEQVRPACVCLVPEKREELTTEGGLNMETVFDDFNNRVFPEFAGTGIKISLFLDPNPNDIELAKQLGADAIELHTGTFANAKDESSRKHELKRLKVGAELIHKLGMRVNAGHGLNLDNLGVLIAEVPHLEEISIGHALVSKSVYWGLERTVQEYLKIMKSGT